MKFVRMEPEAVDIYGEHWRQSDKIHKITDPLHAGILMKFVRMKPEAVVTYGEYW